MTEEVGRVLAVYGPGRQAELGKLLGVEQQTISGWAAKLRNKERILVRKTDAQRRIEDVALKAATERDGFRDGVRLAINEARSALDDLEVRLLATTPASTVEPAGTGDEHDAAAAARAQTVSPATRTPAESEKGRRTKKKPA
jgi:hypothetical protein